MKLSIGTAQFGFNYGITNKLGKINSNEVKKIIELASSHGINSLDTAQDYFESERIIGKFTKNKKFSITTKLSNDDIKIFNTENIETCDDKLKLSLDNLKIKTIDTLLLHKPLDSKKN